IELLLNAGADPNEAVLSHGETPLMMAARTGKPDAVKVLLDHGALVNAVENLRGTTALMWAAEQNHAEVVQLLADRDADISARSTALRLIKRSSLGFARAGLYGQIPPSDPIAAMKPSSVAAR